MSFSTTGTVTPHTLRSVASYMPLGIAVIGCLVVGLRYGSPNLVVMAAIATASLTSSIAGFAFSPICGAMLFHLWDDQVQVVQIMIVCSIANQATMVWTLRHNINGRDLWVFLLGGALGLPLGVWMLLHANRAVYTRALGVFLITYGAYMLASKPHVLRWKHRGPDMLAGFLGGITGGAAGFPGASVTIWCGLKGWDKVQQRALYQPFILVMQIAALFAISSLRQPTGRGVGFEAADLLYIPAGLFGTRLGIVCFQKMSDRQFSRAVNILLMVSGLSYVI